MIFSTPPDSRAWVRLNGRPRGPRIYRKDVVQVGASATEPGLVAVKDPEDTHHGWALWHPRSQIALRFLDRGTAPPTSTQICERAERAALLRLANPEIPEQVCRILHAEGDGFPGLTVDRYSSLLVGRAYSLCSLKLFEAVQERLHQVLGTEHHRIEFDESSARAESEKPTVLCSRKFPPRLKIEEQGIRYELDFLEGHKTGFFCDQRENRERVRRSAAGKRVLDVCCYTGGFALAAAAGDASEVLALDLDEKAIAQAKRNANLNGPGLARRIRWVHADAFSYLRTLGRNRREFDLIILDPPKFIPNRRAWDDGIARYHDLNKLAIPLLAAGGELVSCSCSGLLQPIELQETIRRAARNRPLTIQRETGAGPDHPVALDFPEGRYLKALWMIDRSPQKSAS